MLNLEVIPLPSSEMIRKLFGLTSNKDIPVLASAISGGVDFLVTGDKKGSRGMACHAPTNLKGKHSFRILSPAEFLDVILPEVLKALDAGEE